MRLPCCLGAFCWSLFGVAAFFASCLFGESMSGATDFEDFSVFRCLFRFLPVVKATDFAGFPFFRCLFPLHKPRGATDFEDFSVFRCLFHFLPAVKASDFAGFPFFRCLLATILTLKATDFWNFLDFHCRLLPERSLLRSFSENHQLNRFLVPNIS